MLKLIETFLSEDPNWVLFSTDFYVNNFVVTSAGQVAMLDLSQVRLHFIPS